MSMPQPKFLNKKTMSYICMQTNHIIREAKKTKGARIGWMKELKASILGACL